MSKTERSALIAALGLIVASVIGYLAAVRPTQIAIEATQTAEARATMAAGSATSIATLAETQRISATQLWTPSEVLGKIDEAGTEPLNWVAPFDKSFSMGFWAEGRHTYILTFICQGGSPSLEVASTFDVSKTAPLYAGAVYLRMKGLFADPLLTFPQLRTISPSQVTIASVSRTNVTLEQAELALAQCSASVSWDGNQAKAMQPGKAYQFLANLSP